jgi:hypothetical protein
MFHYAKLESVPHTSLCIEKIIQGMYALCKPTPAQEVQHLGMSDTLQGITM